MQLVPHGELSEADPPVKNRRRCDIASNSEELSRRIAISNGAGGSKNCTLSDLPVFRNGGIVLKKCCLLTVFGNRAIRKGGFLQGTCYLSVLKRGSILAGACVPLEAFQKMWEIRWRMKKGEESVMAIEVSYLFLTPCCLRKSRTGGIIARLMSQTDLDFIGAQMLAFTPEIAESYARTLEKTEDEATGKRLADYVRKNFPSRKDGRKECVMMLLFRGEDACRKLTDLSGKLPLHSPESSAFGETLRDTYADVVEDPDNPGVVRYFEPAVLTPPNLCAAIQDLRMFADFVENAPNLVSPSPASEQGEERTLVIIKPDNWRYPSCRPGSIIDMLSRTGLRIVGCKVHRMSVNEALEFYHSVQGALRSKLAPKIGEQAKRLFEETFQLSLPENTAASLTESVGIPYADDQFSQLIEFMSGKRPEACTQSEKALQNAQAKCLVLIYEGRDAIAKVRAVLGPTDPAKAPGGTIRRDFGSNVMVNAIHASDSPSSVEREMKIIRMHQNPMAVRIREFLNENKEGSPAEIV